MNTFDPAEHPRATTGAFTSKHRDEPESDGLAAVPLASTPTTGADWISRWHAPDGQLHRTDGPTITKPDGSEEWWVHGQRHRDDGPAETRADGSQRWYRHGVVHRDDGPAIIHPDGTLEWFKNGKHHRVGGPAVVLAGGGEQWYVDGEPHRADGPAFIWPDGELEWWEDGEQKPPEVEAMLTMLWHARNPEDA